MKITLFFSPDVLLSLRFNSDSGLVTYPVQVRCDTDIAWRVTASTSKAWHKTHYSNLQVAVAIVDHQSTTTISLKHYHHDHLLL